MVINRREFLGIAGGLLIGRKAFSLDRLLQDAKIVTLLKNGSNETRFDMLILSEGYTKEKEFVKDAESIVKAFDDHSILKEDKPLINVHYAYLQSTKEWTTDSDGSGTPFKVTCDSEKTLQLGNEKLRDELKAQAKADLPCIILRENGERVTGYSGTDGVLAVVTRMNRFFHEFGHGADLEDEYAKTEDSVNAINTSTDEKNPMWKPAIGKAKGIGIYPAKDSKGQVIKGYWKGEEQDCLMYKTKDGIDWGPLCSNGLHNYFRRFAKCIESATEEKVLEIGKGNPLGIELKVTPTVKYSVNVQAWYCTGSDEELTKTQQGFPAILSAADFKDEKKWKKATVAQKGKGLEVKATLTPGSHLVVVSAYDPNPAILIDPNGDTKDKRAYRVDVKE